MLRLTQEQEKYVRENYETKNYREMSEFLGLPWEPLRKYGKYKLGLNKGRGRRFFWTDGEKEKLRQCYTTQSKSEILKTFPNRTWQSIMGAAQKEGLTYSLMNEYSSLSQELSLTDAQAAYIAGLIDGEGCVYILKVKNKQESSRPQRKKTDEYLVAGFSICNTDPKMIEFAHGLLGGTVNHRVAKKKMRRDLYVANVRGFRALQAARAVRPYMITKQAAMGVLIRYLELRMSKRKCAPLGVEEFQLYEEWRKLCPPKSSPEWDRKYST